MLRAVKTLALAGVMTGLVASFASAQSMEETVSKLGAAAGKAYVAPIVSGFGTNLNAGWFHKSPPPKKWGINFEVGPVAMGTFLSGGSKTMNVTGAFRLDSAQAYDIASNVDTAGMFGQGQRLRDSVAAAVRRNDVNVAFSGETIIGPGDRGMDIIVVAQPITVGKPGGGDTTINIDPYVDSIPQVTGQLGKFLKYPFPLVTPQITIGTLYGTNLTLRYLPEYTIQDVGTVKFSGFGIQHNPAVWLDKPLPVDLSFGFFTQTLEVGSLFKATSQAYGVNVSKTWGWRVLNVTPYGGFMLENSKFDFSYDLEIGEEGEEELIPVEFSVKGENKYRATAGVSVRLLVVNINADYNIGKYHSVSAGVMVGI